MPLHDSRDLRTRNEPKTTLRNILTELGHDPNSVLDQDLTKRDSKIDMKVTHHIDPLDGTYTEIEMRVQESIVHQLTERWK